MRAPTCSPERLDALRAAHPDLAFALYALEPRGLVTLEVITPDGQSFTWQALTAEAAMNEAFPPESVPANRPEPTQAEIDGVAKVFEEVALDPTARASAIIMAKKLRRVFLNLPPETPAPPEPEKPGSIFD